MKTENVFVNQKRRRFIICI